MFNKQDEKMEKTLTTREHGRNDIDNKMMVEVTLATREYWFPQSASGKLALSFTDA